MSNVNNITSKILKDAEVERDSILASAEEEKRKIISKKVDSAKVLETQMLDKAKNTGNSLKDRIISSAKLKVRNDKLVEKQAIIEEIFNASIEELSKIEGKDFLNFIKNSILAMDIDSEKNLILNQKGLNSIETNFIENLNKEIKGNIKLINKPGNFKGGFILEKDGIEINNTYEALVSAYRDELELEIVKVLFN